MVNKLYRLHEASKCYNKEQGKGCGRLGKEIEILNRVVREDSAEKATFEPRWEEMERINYIDAKQETEAFPAEGTMCLPLSRKSRILGLEQGIRERGEDVVRGLREPDHGKFCRQSKDLAFSGGAEKPLNRGT